MFHLTPPTAVPAENSGSVQLKTEASSEIASGEFIGDVTPKVTSKAAIPGQKSTNTSVVTPSSSKSSGSAGIADPPKLQTRKPLSKTYTNLIIADQTYSYVLVKDYHVLG